MSQLIRVKMLDLHKLNLLLRNYRAAPSECAGFLEDSIDLVQAMLNKATGLPQPEVRELDGTAAQRAWDEATRPGELK